MSEKIRNEHDVLINVVELASELADAKLRDGWDFRDGEIDEGDENETHYTEIAQDLFNDLYDSYYELILSCKSN